MNQIDALQRLKKIGPQVFETRDATALLAVSAANANVILARLAKQGLLTHLARGRWVMGRSIARFALPEMIIAPHPAYVSLQSALFHRGIIEQIPAVIYAVTLARPRRITTPLGTISFHRLPPELFLGFEVDDDGAKIASAEKALFDVLYLAPGRSRLFARLPELEFPREFRWSRVRDYARLVQSTTRRTFIRRRIGEIRRDARR